MAYLGILVIMSSVRRHYDRQVWQAYIRDYDWSITRVPLGDLPSPVKVKKPFLLSVSAPVPAQTEFSRRMVGDIEKQDPSRADAPQPNPTLPPMRAARPTLIIPQHLGNSGPAQITFSASQAPQTSRNVPVSNAANPSVYPASTRPGSPQSPNDGEESPRSSPSPSSYSSRRSRRSPTARRPPPLDLSKITAFR